MNKFLDEQNRKVNDLLSKQTYFKNPEHMRTIQNELREKSPIRIAK